MMYSPGPSNAPLRVSLRPSTEADVPFFFAQQRDPDTHHMVAFGAKDPNDWEVFSEKWRKIHSDPATDTRAVLFEGRVVGHVVCFVKEGKPQAGYLIDKAHWGKGIASEAMRLFLRSVAIRPLYAGTSWDNLASMRVLEKCGFMQIGKTRSFGNARGCEIEEVLWMLS